MAIEITEGNLFDTDADVIAHQVNCMGKMGSGAALQVKQRYNEAYLKYVELCEKEDNLLGLAQCVQVGDKIIANLFAQSNFGYDGIRYTNYEALFCSLESLDKQLAKSLSIALPYNIGCDRGGGDWNIVCAMIESALKDRNVYIYRLKGE